MEGVGDYSGRVAGVLSVVVAIVLVALQSYFSMTMFLSGSVKISDFDVHYLVWYAETLMAVGGNLIIVFVGIATNLSQAPWFMRKIFTLLVGMQAYLFLFGEWEMLAFIGYWIFFREGLELFDPVAFTWYKVTLVTMACGSASLQLQSSLRYWYWDYYYAREAGA